MKKPINLSKTVKYLFLFLCSYNNEVACLQHELFTLLNRCFYQKQQLIRRRGCSLFLLEKRVPYYDCTQ